jgi:endoglucanase
MNSTAVTWQFLIDSTDIRSTSNQTLDPTNAAAYDTAVRACLSTGATCIIDIHNYARFEGKVIGQGGPTNAQFASLWSQIASKVEF